MKTGNTTDVLLERAVAGDARAFAELFDRFAGRLRHYVSDRMGARLTAQLDPEDLLQEVFAEVFTRIGRYRPMGKGSFYRLLVTIANRRLMNHERDLSVRPEGHLAREGADICIEEGVGGSRKPPTGPITALVREEERELCREAFRQLPEKDRMILRLRMEQGLSAGEIGDLTGKSKGAVLVWFHRALKAWSEKLERLREKP